MTDRILHDEITRLQKQYDEAHASCMAYIRELASVRQQNARLLDLLEDIRNGDPTVELMPAWEKAVDGGALEASE